MAKALDLLKSTFKDFSADKCPTYAAALSYATVFALPPLLMLVFAIVGMFVDPADFRGRVVTEIQKLVGAQGAQMIGQIIQGAHAPGKGVMAILGIIMLVVGATGAFVALQDALNTAWGVKPDPKQGGVKAFIKKRIFSFGMIFVIGFMLLISFVMAAVIAAAGDMLRGSMGGAGELIAQAVQIVFGLLVTWALFAAIFKVLPDAKISWRDVRVGALVTAILFTLGRVGIVFYIAHSKTASTFGAASALAVLLIWIYYAALILLMGAEFTQIWATQHGRDIEPEEGAVRILPHN
jgi:membrane protein